jgi:hypothetical protein
MNRYLLFLIISICLSSCKEKADINKLYNEAEECFELTFKYANVNGIDYASVTEDDVYRMEYDKVRSQFHIWTIRFADLRINETFYVRLNKFYHKNKKIKSSFLSTVDNQVDTSGTLINYF